MDDFAVNSSQSYAMLQNRSWTDRTFSKMEPGSVRGSIFTLASSAIGAGLLALPLVLHQSGLILGVVLIIVACLLATLSIYIMIACGDAMGIKEYGPLTTIVLGKRWGDVLELVLVLYCFGACVAYMVVIEQCAQSIFDALGVTGVFSDDRVIVAIITAAIVFPLSLLRNLSSLRFASIFSVFSMIYVCFAIFGRSLTLATSKNITLIRMDMNFFTSATICIFAFTAHVNLFPIYKELRAVANQATTKRMQKVAIRSALVETGLYLLIGVAGYLSYPTSTNGNVLQNYNDTDPTIIVGRVAVTATMSVALPLCFNPARSNLYSLFLKHRRAGSAGPAQLTRAERRASQARREQYLKEHGMPGDASQPLSAQITGAAGTYGVVETTKSINEPILKDDQREGDEGEDEQEAVQLASEVGLVPHFFTTLALVAASLGLAIAIPEVSIVFGFLGATCSIFFCYILPIMLYQKIFAQELYNQPLKKYSLWTLLVIVVIVGCTSVVQSILNAIS